MRLFYTSNSPYARIARVGVLELALGDEVEFQLVTVRDSHSSVLEYTPTGKVPALLTDEGHTLIETRVICEYLQLLAPTTRNLLATIDDVSGRQLEGLATGFLDGVAVWVREVRRASTEQSPAIIELERDRAVRCVNWLEQARPRLDQQASYAMITLASTLGILDFTALLVWRDGRPGLGEWYDVYRQRPSMQATEPVPMS